ncbi:MAG: SLATT domain-containing protein [Fermentimonas sp.]|nr:SLATT domain-containing protein [Fermentimonas sp.]
MNESTRLLYKCIEGRYVKVTWTHKIQEIQGDIYLQKDRCVKNITCWLSVLTAGGALSFISSFIEPQISGSITSFLAIILSYFTVRFKDGQLEEKAKVNKYFAAKLHDVRNKYESLMTDILAGLLNDSEIVDKRNELREEEDLLYSNKVPHTFSTAVKRAEKALKTNKESTTEEDEIDAIVPKDLIVH